MIGNIINEDQVGLIKGRKVSTLLKLIDDTMDYLNTSNLPGILFAVDYLWALNSVFKDFINWEFQRFGLGKSFCRWVKVLTANTESSINYMGWLSEPISVESGIRQGCPFSPMTFILGLELLALKMRSTPTIKGIKLPDLR